MEAGTPIEYIEKSKMNPGGDYTGQRFVTEEMIPDRPEQQPQLRTREIKIHKRSFLRLLFNISLPVWSSQLSRRSTARSYVNRGQLSTQPYKTQSDAFWSISPQLNMPYRIAIGEIRLILFRLYIDLRRVTSLFLYTFYNFVCTDLAAHG